MLPVAKQQQKEDSNHGCFHILSYDCACKYTTQCHDTYGYSSLCPSQTMKNDLVVGSFLWHVFSQINFFIIVLFSVAPLCFLYKEPVMLYYVFREIYTRYFFRLHSISSHPQVSSLHAETLYLVGGFFK